jgi:hypothetical protein
MGEAGHLLARRIHSGSGGFKCLYSQDRQGHSLLHFLRAEQSGLANEVCLLQTSRGSCSPDPFLVSTMHAHYLLSSISPGVRATVSSENMVNLRAVIAYG